ncbi:MAG TPA: hypothetical protein VF950_15120 [Planctomycetota bacterium]
MPYTVILHDDVPVDPRVYGPVVAPMLGLTVLEARLAVRKGRGILLEGLKEADAKALVARLAGDGIQAEAVDTLPQLPPPRKVLQLEHGDDLLGYGEGEALPWDALDVVSIGVVARPEHQELFTHVDFRGVPPIHKLEGAERDLIRENLLLKMSARPKGVAPKRKPDAVLEEIDRKWGGKVKVYLDLLTADAGTWLRVPMDEIAYRYMAGSIRMGGAWGMQALVNDLVEKRLPAFVPMTLKLLDVVDIKTLVFPQVEEFTRYTAWCALRRLLWPNPDATSSPSPEPPASPTDAGSSTSSPAPEPPSISS